MKVGLTSVSRLALLIGAAGVALPAWGQDASPASAPSTQVEEIVVTGSNIRGSALDAALPVEVYSQKDLEKQGSPTALEFAKSLTISGPTTGESYYFGGLPLVGSVNYNLRGLGADKTLVLLIPFPVVDATSYYIFKTDEIKPSGVTFPSFERGYGFKLNGGKLDIYRL